MPSGRRSSVWGSTSKRAAATGRSACWLALERCLRTAPKPKTSTARRSTGWAEPGSARSSRVRTCSTASGSGERTGGSMRARAAPHRPRDVHRDGDPWLRRTRAATSCLATGETVRKRTVELVRRAHAAGGAHRAARRRRSHEPRDRRAALHQPPHRRVAPRQGLLQARDHFAVGAPRRSAKPGASFLNLASASPFVGASHLVASGRR